MNGFHAIAAIVTGMAYEVQVLDRISTTAQGGGISQAAGRTDLGGDLLWDDGSFIVWDDSTNTNIGWEA